jgi:hypothetical protein
MGIVQDVAGSPVAGARVTVEGEGQAITRSDGRFEAPIRGTRESTVMVRVDKAG